MSAPRAQRSSDTLDAQSQKPQQQQQPQQRPPTPSRNSYNSHDGAVTSVFSSAAAPNPTYATFSPATLSSTNPTTSAAKRRSTILVHQKSPLLLATPPQITRALAYSHPFLLPLNRLVGLLTWTTGDPWESFLLVVVYWATVLYGDILVRTAGPLILVLFLIIGMYGRRFSPLSSSGWSEPGSGAGGDGSAVSSSDAKGVKTGKSKNLSVDGIPEKAKTENGAAGAGAAGGGGHKRNQGSISEATTTRHQKTLDEIVENLKEFTARCNILLEPLLELTDFLSTQQTPTSATTRPALTTLFVRILLCTPFWFLLTLPPMRIITTRRVILLVGTIILTWHARVIRITRTIIWRSATIRRLASLVTGLQFEIPVKKAPSDSKVQFATNGGATSSKDKQSSGATASVKASRGHESELTKALRRARGGHDTGVRFTFIIYENQRRWVGLGWTTSLFAYERPAWTDEHNNAVPPRDEFELPEVEDGSNMRWRWVEGSRWRVDGVPDDAVMSTSEDGDDGNNEWDYDGPGGRQGWVYYDNKWQNGRRGQDGWGRWTRRRKWYRDAELVEADMVEDEIVHTQPGSEAGMTYGVGAAAGADVHATPKASTTTSSSRSATGSVMSTASTTTDLATPDIYSSSPRSSSLSSQLIINKTRDRDRDKVDRDSIKEDDSYSNNDSASMLSTSSRSTNKGKSGFLGIGATSLMRRRVTDSSGASHKSGSAGGSARRASNSGGTATGEEDDAAIMSLGTSTRLALQDAGNEGSQWGVGDELRMGLE